MRRDSHVISLQVQEHRRQHQLQHHRISPHQNTEQTGRYQHSPVNEEYDSAVMVSQPGSIQLTTSSTTYSPPIELRTSQQQIINAAYAEATNGTLKYDTETTVAADSIKVSSTYTTLETAALAPVQTVPYNQYLVAADAFQQPGGYGYAKSGEFFFLPTSNPSGVRAEVSFSSLPYK